MALLQIAVAAALFVVTVAGAALESNSSVIAESKEYDDGQVIDFKKLYPDVFDNGSDYGINVTLEEYFDGGGFHERILSRIGKTIFAELPEIRKSLETFGRSLDKTFIATSIINDAHIYMSEFINRTKEVMNRFVPVVYEHEVTIFSGYLYDISWYHKGCVENLKKGFERKMDGINEQINGCITDVIRETNATIQNDINQTAYAIPLFTQNFENVIKCVKRTYLRKDQAIGCVEIAMENGRKNNQSFSKFLVILESRITNLKIFMPGEICFDRGMQQIRGNYFAKFAKEVSKCDKLNAEEKM